MYSNSARTAIRFTLIKPTYKAASWLDIHVLKNRLIPFQIYRASRPNLITTFNIVEVNPPNNTADLLGIMTAGTEPYIYSIVGKDYLIYKADIFPIDLTPGRYYLELSDGVQTWYSMDIINVACYALSEPDDINVVNFDDNQIDIDNNNPLIFD